MSRKLVILISFLPIFCFSQENFIGTPRITNYLKSDYNAGTQNWNIAQDEKGYVYFANNDGLLQFDGQQWSTIEISDNSPIRSVYVDSNNNVYVGLINDFGVIVHDIPSMPYYKSLRDLLPQNFEDFDDVWKIHEIPEGIIFQCFDHIFLLKDDSIEIIEPNQRFRFSFLLENRLLVHEPGIGLFEYKNQRFVFLPWSEVVKDKLITAVLENSENEMLICTIGEGVFKYTGSVVEEWNTPANGWLRTNNLLTAVQVMDDHYAFGSILDGIVISDKEGNIVQQISRREGLQNNTVLSMFADSDKNLWLGLDNGIDFIEINSPIRYITRAENIGTGYCSVIYENNLYLGTNQGLYVRPFTAEANNLPFELVSNTAGQVWSLGIYDNQLVCGHHNGTFLIRGSRAVKISEEEGVWKYIKLKNRQEYLLGGHYSGLILLRKGSQGWEFYKKLNGFDESSRYLYQDNSGQIWISHGSRGIFKVVLDENAESIKEYKLYGKDEGLPSDLGNIIFSLDDRFYVATQNKIYSYNQSTDTFAYDEAANNLLNVDGRIKTLKQDNAGNIWYIAGKDAGVFRLNEDQSYTQITAPFKVIQGEFVNEFEFIYPYNEDNLFMGIYDGFAHYSSKFSKSYTKSFTSLITQVEIPYLDTTMYFNSRLSEVNFVLPFRKNEFRMHYSAPYFENIRGIQYSYFLDNYSEKWSDWTNDSYKDFTNLPEGEYTFKIKAKNIYGIESNTAELKFEILPPWHRSTTAYYVYAIFLLVLGFLIVRFVIYRIELSKKKEKRKHENELKRKEEEYQRQSLIAEKEIIRLRNDKLRAEKTHRDKELANQTMNIIQKNKLLMNLNGELQRIQNSTNDSSVITRLVLIKKRISRELDDKQQNNLFETYFEDVHADFFKRLKEKFPQLSPNDLRLCAYIRMNISTKEIATLFNISYRGVEIHRYRLRKKLNLSRDINLSTYLSGI